MLIEKYDLEVFTPPCEPGAERLSAIARLMVDISEALPYLNATLRGAVYNPSAPALSWTKAGHYVVFQPYQIAVSNVADREAAAKEVDGLVGLVNRTWERRAEITPDYTVRRRPAALELYKLLPGTNCRECGQPTCFTFALKLAANQARLQDCPRLAEPQYADRLAQLQSLVIEAPALG
jgi:ArsR family metal-binding transcriptional regulator